MGIWRSGGWRLLVRSGLADRWQRRRLRNTLTVVGLHRVLPIDDPRRPWAIADYTITDDVFAAFVEFAAPRYTFVDLDQVADACVGGRPLPPRALLLTFDDGWSDTVDVALPILQRMGLPSVVFVIAGRIGCDQGLWRGELRARLTTEPHALGDAVARLAPAHATDDRGRQVLALDDALRLLPEAERARAISSIGSRPPSSGPQMATAAALRSASSSGMAVGAHGLTHTAMTDAGDLAAELSGARTSLANALLVDPAVIRSVSFPHGRYSPTVVEAARNAGFELFMTSERTANPVAQGRLASRLLGRLWIGQEALAGALTGISTPPPLPPGSFSPRSAFRTRHQGRPFGTEAGRGRRSWCGVHATRRLRGVTSGRTAATGVASGH